MIRLGWKKQKKRCNWIPKAWLSYLSQLIEDLSSTTKED